MCVIIRRRFFCTWSMFGTVEGDGGTWVCQCSVWKIWDLFCLMILYGFYAT